MQNNTMIEYGIFDDKSKQYGMTYDNLDDFMGALNNWRKDMPHLKLFSKQRVVIYSDWK